MTADSMTATVVVPTFRRPENLARLLAALARQHDPGVPWDVVVVDNDDPPGAQETFDRITPQLDVPVRLVREERRGASHTRNRGMREVTASVTVFIDDDVVPDERWLATLLAPIVAGRCEGTGGRVVLDPTVPRPRWFDETGIGGYLAAHDVTDEERALVDGEFVITANAAFDTAILGRGGGFEGQLGPRPGVQLVNDDVLLCDRFRDAGGRVRHVPDAVVIHELPAERLRPRYLLRRAYAQGRSDWIYFTMTIGRRAGLERTARWFANALAARWRERPWRLPVAFHLACDVARLAGVVREVAALSRRGFTAVPGRGWRAGRSPGRTRR